MNLRYRVVNVLMLAAVLVVAGWLAFGAAGGNVYAEQAVDSKTVTGERAVAGGAFEITKFDCNMIVNKDHSYDIEEKITVNIPDDLTKIEFAIPSGNFRLRGLTVEDTEYTARKASEASTVSIVDPDKLAAGVHEYTIKYRILEFADRDESKDLLYYSVLLPEWKQPIADLIINVTFPGDFPVDSVKCYAGQYGVQDTENRIKVTTDTSMSIMHITGSLIPENFGITLKADLEDGYWEGALDGVWAILAMVLVMGSALLVLIVMWIIGGRDPRFRRTAETRPITEVSPVEFGYVFNSSLSIRDLVRLILWMGTKGYLRISEYEPKRYRLYRLNDPDGEEKLIRNAYNILFEDVYKGRALEMDDIGERLLRMEGALRDDVAAGFSSKESLAYTPLSRAFRIAGIVITAAALAAANGLKYSYQYLPVNYPESIIIGLAAGVIMCVMCAMDDRRYASATGRSRIGEMVAGALLIVLAIYVAISIGRTTGHYISVCLIASILMVCAFFTVIMRARGRENAALVMRYRQLRRFIYHPTPKELLENYLADNNYYYDMMLYALTFGAEESWAISFLTLDVPEPDWYRDEIEGHAFSNLRDKPTTIDYARDLRSFTRTIESAYQNMQRRHQ